MDRRINMAEVRGKKKTTTSSTKKRVNQTKILVKFL